MGSKPVEDLIEASSGVHFSGFHLKSTDPSTLVAEQPTTSATENIKQPFVIGVAGGASSGKTTVCDMIIEQLRDQCVRSPLTKDNHKINGAASKKPTKTSLSKPKTQSSSTSTKVKNVETEEQINAHNSEKVEDRPHCPSESEQHVEEAPVKDSSLCNGNSEATPANASVKG